MNYQKVVILKFCHNKIQKTINNMISQGCEYWEFLTVAPINFRPNCCNSRFVGNIT